MLTYTKHSLKKLETLLTELSYTVRYERGNFNSGYCIVENKKIIVINRFFDTEARISSLLEILGSIEVDTDVLSAPSRKVLKQIAHPAGSSPALTPKQPD